MRAAGHHGGPATAVDRSVAWRAWASPRRGPEDTLHRHSSPNSAPQPLGAKSWSVDRRFCFAARMGHHRADATRRHQHDGLPCRHGPCPVWSDNGPVQRDPKPQSYSERLLEWVDAFERDFLTALQRSTILNIDPNTPGDGVAFIGFPMWGWGGSDSDLASARMDLLGRFREFKPLFDLLFPHPTPEVRERNREALDLLERWLERPAGDHSVPSNVEAAADQASQALDVLRDAQRLLPRDEIAVRLVTDTNALIDNPDLAIYRPRLGDTYRVHLMPVVLRERDHLNGTAETRRSERMHARPIGD